MPPKVMPTATNSAINNLKQGDISAPQSEFVEEQSPFRSADKKSEPDIKDVSYQQPKM